jgi:hypothetical protein
MIQGSDSCCPPVYCACVFQAFETYFENDVRINNSTVLVVTCGKVASLNECPLHPGIQCAKSYFFVFEKYPNRKTCPGCASGII